MRSSMLIIMSMLLGSCATNLSSNCPSSPQQITSNGKYSGCAFDKANFNKVVATGITCTDCSFTNSNFSGSKLNHADLQQSTFNKVNLTNTDLSGADLRSSIFIKSNLTKAQGKGLMIVGSDFSSSTWVDGSICQDGSIGKCKK